MTRSTVQGGVLQIHSIYKFKLQVEDGQLPSYIGMTQAFGHH
jgi:hypothetical protein